MAFVINAAASQAETDAYKAYVAWLKEAERVRGMFLGADLSLPRTLERLFQESPRKRRSKARTK